MTIASGILKTSAFMKQSALGTAASGAGGSELRRVTNIFTAPVDTYESNEIQTHHQSTGTSIGLHRVTGAVSG